jgi:hypothetical protein
MCIAGEGRDGLRKREGGPEEVKWEKNKSEITIQNERKG